MSKFNDDNLFGTGNHKIEFHEMKADSWMFGFPGIQGSFRVNNGFRYRSGTITGTLRASDAEELAELEDAIMRYVTDGTSAILEDNFGSEHPNVVLENYIPQGPRQKNDKGELLQDYIVPFKQLARE